MTVDTMRVIDYYVGIPLCFLASLWLKLVTLITRKSPWEKPRRVLFIELSEMGSTILADPSIKWTQSQGAEAYFVIFKRNVGSLRLLGTIPEKNQFLIREENLGIFAWDTLRFLIWTRVQKIDTVVDLELFSRFSSLLTAFCGATKRVGFHAFFNEGLYRGEVLTCKVAYNPHIHVAKNFMALARSMFATENSVPFYKGEVRDQDVPASKVQIKEEARQRVLEALKKHSPDPLNTTWVLLNCAGGEFLMQRRWPTTHYAQLAQKILDQHPNARILLTGSPQERQEVDEVRILSQRDRCINFAGEIAFGDLTALYSLSNVLITNDSGPAHFASTTEIPTYVFFGPETPKLYGSLGKATAIYANFACSPCVTAMNHRKTPCTNNLCLKVITADQVYNMVQKEL